MLSVDNYAGQGGSSQSYNRYSYVYNNPLMYTDPSGELAGVVCPSFGSTIFNINSALSIGANIANASAFAARAASGGFGGPPTEYINKLTNQSVTVNDGLSGTIYLNDSDFEEALFFSNEINPTGGYTQPDIADAYVEFYFSHRSFEGGGLRNYMTYLFKFDTPRAGQPVSGHSPLMELIGGPTSSAAKTAVRSTRFQWFKRWQLRLWKFNKHHLVPKNVFLRDKYYTILTEFTTMNAKANLKKIPAAFHGNHPAYDEFVMQKLDNLIREGGGTISPGAYDEMMIQLRGALSEAYQSGKTLNQYFKDLGYIKRK